MLKSSTERNIAIRALLELANLSDNTQPLTPAIIRKMGAAYEKEGLHGNGKWQAAYNEAIKVTKVPEIDIMDADTAICKRLNCISAQAALKALGIDFPAKALGRAGADR